MNFIITTECNKGCSYCFANEPNKHTNIIKMSLEKYKELLDKIPDNTNMPIKLLGGEPTQHPLFKEFVSEALSRNKEVVIISNFLFNEDILKFLLSVTGSGKISFLINSTGLDINNRIKLFSKNYNTLFSYLYGLDLEEKMSCGITLETDKDVLYYLEYIDFLLEHIKKIEKIRISLNFPGNKKDKNDFYFLNNKELGEKFLILSKKSIDIGANYSVDCIIFPCMFENKEEFKLVKKFVEKLSTFCNGVPADIFPDGIVSYCYPLKESIKVDSKNHKYLEDSLQELKIRYSILENKIVDKLPEICISCKFRSRGICHGPCLGFFDLSEENIGINV